MTEHHDDRDERLLAAYDAALAAGDDAEAEAVAATDPIRDEPCPFCNAEPGEPCTFDGYTGGQDA